MDVLNNRASTKAKIQKYDTMREQIQVRRSELTKRILEEQTSGNKQQKEKEKYEVTVQTTVSTYEEKVLPSHVNHFFQKMKRNLMT